MLPYIVAPSILVERMEYVTNMTDPAVFLCTATGFPAPSISWYRVRTDDGETDNYDDMVTVTMNSSMLLLSGAFEITVEVTLSDTMGSDSGEYLCNATNTAGSDAALFSLLVQCM